MLNIKWNITMQLNSVMTYGYVFNVYINQINLWAKHSYKERIK
jgi:hypothetical protein